MKIQLLLISFSFLSTNAYDELFMHVNGEPVSNGAHVLVPQGKNEIDCSTFTPYHDILWFVDSRPYQATRLEKSENSSHVRSVFEVNFYQGSIFHISCVLSGTIILTRVTFEAAVETKRVTLSDKSRHQERFVLNDEEKIIQCRADGAPWADDFLIKKATEADNWEIVSTNSTHRVVESGSYMCEARNRYLNGTAIGHYVKSGALRFIHLGNMEQKLSDLDEKLSKMVEMIEKMKNTIGME